MVSFLVRLNAPSEFVRFAQEEASADEFGEDESDEEADEDDAKRRLGKRKAAPGPTSKPTAKRPPKKAKRKYYRMLYCPVMLIDHFLFQGDHGWKWSTSRRSKVYL